MFDKDIMLFSLVGLIGDDMPYVLSELNQKSQAVRYGSSFTCDTAILTNIDSKSFSIEYPDGYSIPGNSDTVFKEQAITCFFPEGTKFIFSNPNSIEGTLRYFPLRKLGGLESVFIILSHAKENQKRRTYVIK
jgi:hypothetical protein